MYSIAIIDDEKETLDVLQRFLTKDNLFKVVTYSNPILALSTVKTQKPDLILLDILMPGLNGIDFLEKINSSNPEIKVIMVTASASLDRIFKSHKFNAYDFVEKPVNLTELESKIQKALGM